MKGEEREREKEKRKKERKKSLKETIREPLSVSHVGVVTENKINRTSARVIARNLTGVYIKPIVIHVLCEKKQFRDAG